MEQLFLFRRQRTSGSLASLKQQSWPIVEEHIEQRRRCVRCEGPNGFGSPLTHAILTRHRTFNKSLEVQRLAPLPCRVPSRKRREDGGDGRAGAVTKGPGWLIAARARLRGGHEARKAAAAELDRAALNSMAELDDCGV